MGLHAMPATKLFAGLICLSLVLGASAQATPSPDPAPSLSADDANIIFRDEQPRRKSAPVLDHERRAGKGGGLSEGVKLETLLWGGGGAIIGSLAGPVGTIAGGAVGFLVGLTIGIVMPRKQSSAKFRS